MLRSRTKAAFGLPEECLAENRADLEALSLPGDDLYYPQYRDWIGIEPWGDRDWDKEALEA
ncbi:MAG: hypothetical protein MJA27_10995 [Pseudanabaenales cyanobacterium]|nr:hypothetical protein [Pseudanabaenales cyanobacterium]